MVLVGLVAACNGKSTQKEAKSLPDAGQGSIGNTHRADGGEITSHTILGEEFLPPTPVLETDLYFPLEAEIPTGLQPPP
jgi:hypothetical protein